VIASAIGLRTPATIRAQRVGHRVPLAEEFRVPRDLDRVRGGRGPAEFRGQPAGGARRDRGLADDERGTGQVRRERARRAEHLRQVVAAARWEVRRAHAQEVHGAEPGRRGEAGGEAQPACLRVAGEHLVQPGLEEPGPAGVQEADLVFVDVHAEHVMTDLSHARGMCGTEMPAPDHGQPHGRVLPILGLVAGGGPSREHLVCGGVCVASESTLRE
jgi:hypothetical protein